MKGLTTQQELVFKDGENILNADYEPEIFNAIVVAQFSKVSFEQYHSSRELDITPSRNSTFPLTSVVKTAKQEYDSIKLPKRATRGSAGYDFFAPFDFTLNSNESIKIPTGIRCHIKEGYVLSIFPRSSFGFKYGVKLANTVGIIDSDYFHADNQGHIFVKLTNTGNKAVEVKQGDAFCQGIFTQYFLTYDDNVTEERTGGIGSTDKRGEE